MPTRGLAKPVVLFLLPGVLLYTGFMVFPLISTIWISFFTGEHFDNSFVFVGIANFRRLLSDPIWAPRFFGALKNTMVFFAINMCVQNPVGLLLASLLTIQSLKGRAIYRTLFFLPTMLSVVIVGFVWQLILSPAWGVAEGLLTSVGLSSWFRPWLGLEEFALPLLALISVWQFIGIPMMLFYAVLVGIPNELLEAARMDGATGWRVYWSIKFPLILPVVAIISILTFIGNLNAFDLIYTTQGVLAGPNFSTDLLGTFFYRTFFGNQLQLGNPTMGAAIAVAMLVITLLGAAIYLVWRRRIQTYEQ